MDLNFDVAEQYKTDIQKAVQILREAGCEEVFIFGSVASKRIGYRSDIDLAIRGCPRGKFFHLLGKLMMELNHQVDLVNLDSRDAFSKFLEKEGELVQIA
jgi:predicted nucleotidyltransferase